MTRPAESQFLYIDGPRLSQAKSSCHGDYNAGIQDDASFEKRSINRDASKISHKKSDGWRDPTNYSSSSLVAKAGTGDTLEIKRYYLCADDGSFVGQRITGVNSPGVLDVVGLPGQLSWLVDKARTNMYNALKGQKFNAGVAFAERKETAELFSNNCTSIAKQVRAFRSSNPKDWAQVVKNGGSHQWKNIPSRWLELQYGWNPLMSDIFGACDALSKKERNPDSYRVSVTGRSKSTQTNVIGHVNTQASSNMWFNVVQEDRHEFKCKCWFVLDNPVLASFSSLGLTNPLEIIWERVPYSFVVDWFVPVGNWISSLDADFGWRFLIGIESYFVRTKAIGEPGETNDDPAIEFVNLSTPRRWEGYSFQRSILSGPPAVGLPHFKNPFSAHHVANALSLLLNAFR